MMGGILFTYYFGEGRLVKTAVVVAVLTLVSCTVMRFRRPREGAVVLLCLLCFAAGSLLLHHTIDIAEPPDSTLLSGRVVSAERTASGGMRYILSELQCVEDDQIIHVPGRAFVYGINAAALPGQKLTLDGAFLTIPEESANPGERNWQTSLWTRGASYEVYARWAYASVSGNPDIAKTALMQIREDLLSKIDRLFPRERDAAMMRALVLGDMGLLDTELRDNFQKLGITHVLAVSGLHVAYIATMLMSLYRAVFFLVPKRYSYLWGKYRLIRAVFISAPLIFYAALTGFAPSILRATVMAVVLLIADVAGRRRDLPNAIAVSALVVMLVRPADIFSLSAQLSYGAVIGIHLYSSHIKKIFPEKLPNTLSESLSVSASAQLGIIPILANAFGRLPLLGLLANLFAVPLSGFALMIVIPVILLSYPLPGLAVVLANIPAFLSRLLEGMTAGASKLPIVSMDIAAPTVLLFFVYYVALFIFAPALKIKQKKLWRAAACLTALLLCFSLAQWGLSLYPRNLEATVFSVGSGQATALRHKSQMILIDSGPTSSYAALDFSRKYGKKYDAVIVTDVQSSRTGALTELIAQERVLSLYLPEERFTDDLPAFIAANAAGIPIHFYNDGSFLEFEEIHIRALPIIDEALLGKAPAVLSVEDAYGQSKLLMMGSLSPDMEAAYHFPQTTLLVAPNRGAYESCGERLLRMAEAEAAVFPCGAAGLGRATSMSYQRITEFVPYPYRADHSGAVTVRFGKTISVDTIKEAR